MNNLKQFYDGFISGVKDFGHDIYIIINSALLLIVYLLGVGFTSLFAKILKKHFLDTKISKKVKSYWSDLGLKKKPIDEYYRQF